MYNRHGLTKTRLYSIFSNMKQRCCNPKNPKYSSYGGKGITICKEWLNDFQLFYDWAIENGYKEYPNISLFDSYYKNLTIDRIDNIKGYEPSNCRWIPFEENRLRKVRNKSLEEVFELPSKKTSPEKNIQLDCTINNDKDKELI